MEEQSLRIPVALRVAIVLTLFQVLMAVAASGALRTRSVADAYLNLTRWDSFWYASIATKGYYTDAEKTKANTAFFPGLPVLSIPIQYAFNVRSRIALALTAQLCMVGFWVYFLSLLRHWRVHPLWQATGTLLILSYPSTYYLVMGYSESPMLFGLIGYIYWLERRADLAIPAMMQGVIMTASRLVSLPVILYPLIQQWANAPRQIAGWLRSTGTAIVASLGAITFLLSLAYSYGDLGYYWHIRSSGWHQREVHSFLLDPTIYLPFPPNVTGFTAPDLGRLSIPVTIAFFLALLIAERRLSVRTWRQRLPLYVTTALVWYVSVIGTSHARDPGHNLFRYSLVFWTMLVLILLHLSREIPSLRARRIALGLAIAFACVCLPLQYFFASQFTHGVWVA